MFICTYSVKCDYSVLMLKITIDIIFYTLYESIWEVFLKQQNDTDGEKGYLSKGLQRTVEARDL